MQSIVRTIGNSHKELINDGNFFDYFAKICEKKMFIFIF